MECERESNSSLTQWTEPWPPPSADHDTGHANESGHLVSKHGGDWGIGLPGKK